MKKFIKYTAFFLLLASSTACKKYLDINDNPNSATVPPINGLVISTTQKTALNTFRVADITNYYVQYLASSGISGATDTYDEIDASSTWTRLFDNMTDLYDLQKFAAEKGKKENVGVAKIMMAMNLQLATNLWGDIPYSDAFKGTTLTPTYDGAKAVYDSCLKLLDEGIVLVQSGTNDLVGTADLIHGGNRAAWVKTAHALKARMLNQVSKTAQYNTASIFTELAAAYSSAADDSKMSTFDVRNPWNQEAVNNAGLLLDGWLSKNYVDAMTGTTYGVVDPRLPLTASLTKFSDYRGTRNGAGRIGNGTSKEESYISLTGFYSSTNSPVYLLTYEEMKFIEAEASLRQAVPDKARAYAAYLAGINANMTKMGVAGPAQLAYVSDPSVSVGAANITLALIFKEKYKALFLQPVTYDDARRFNFAYTGFQLPLNAIEAAPARRLVYPTVEVTRNGGNVPTVSGVLAKIWWDL